MNFVPSKFPLKKDVWYGLLYKYYDDKVDEKARIIFNEDEIKKQKEVDNCPLFKPDEIVRKI